MNAALHAVASALRAAAPAWLTGVVPAIAGIALHFDPGHAELPPDPVGACSGLLEEALIAAQKAENEPRLVEVPVCYDPHFALDIVEVATATGVAPEDIAQLHAATEHRVLMIGFAPGQPYIGGLDRRLAVPRRATPRTRVPQGSIAIANDQTCVYPIEIAGGWSVIGRTPLAVFDAARTPPNFFEAGDRVRFVPISRGDYERVKGAPP